MFENRENLFYLKLPTRNYFYFHRKKVSSYVFYRERINHEGTFKKVFDIRYRIVFSSRRNRINYPFCTRNHSYFQRKLRVEPEQLSILFHQLPHRIVSDNRTLVNQDHPTGYFLHHIHQM